MSTRSVLVATLALVLTGTGCQPPTQEAAGLSEEDVAAIKRTVDSIVRATLDGDWEAWETYWTEDAMTMYAHSPPVEGRAEVRDSWQSANITDFVATPLKIEGRDGLAYVRGAYSLAVAIEGMPESVSDQGKFLLILKKSPDGSWAVAIDAASTNEPLPEPSAEPGT
jgi:ketosteroid isomerase-like protein